MFAAQKGPGKPIVILKSFQWNVRWRAHFGKNVAGGPIVQLPSRPGDVLDMNLSHVVKGAPNDSRFERFVLDSRLPNCNAVIRSSHAHPIVHESAKWENWKVTH